MSRSFKDNTTTSFPKMGDEGIPHSVVNMSGQRSPYTQSVAKKTMGRGSSPTGTTGSRSRTLIKEAQGPAGHPVTTICYPNSPEAAKTQSRTYIVKSKIGDRDFMSRRQYQQGM